MAIIEPWPDLSFLSHFNFGKIEVIEIANETVFMELVKEWTGVKNPPRWLYCFYANIPYKVNWWKCRVY